MQLTLRLDNLERFGLKLTREESCHHGMRNLFLLNADGLRLLGEYFGPTVDIKIRPQNGSINDKPVRSSILLPTAMVEELICFILFRRYHYGYIFADPGQMVYTGFNDPNLVSQFIEQGVVWRNYALDTSTRHTH